MKRQIILLLVIVLSFMAMLSVSQPAQALSAGCSAVGGLSGFYFEVVTVNQGTWKFEAGETVAISSTITGQLTIPEAGFSQTGPGVISFKIPTNGTYTIIVSATGLGGDGNISVSCRGADGTWSGYSDGRLNPFIAENYSLWCASNMLQVYKMNGTSGNLIASIPISKLLALNVGGGLATAASDGTTLAVARTSNDDYLVYSKSSSNISKSFAMTECLGRNGVIYTPTGIPTATRIPATLTPTFTPTPIDSASVGTILVSLNPTTEDTDGDGIRNHFDLCPNDPAPGKPFGCPDTDGDGVYIPYDRCPTAVGTALTRGCPDTDGDGLADQYDLCPNYKPPSDKPSALGCGDPDGDGFPNTSVNGQAYDWCPLQGLTIGINHVMGCPDPDNDGLVSGNRFLIPTAYYDYCPVQAGPVTLTVCAPQTNTQQLLTPTTTVPTLFQYAAITGAFTGLVVQTSSTTCKGSVGQGGFMAINC